MQHSHGAVHSHAFKVERDEETNPSRGAAEVWEGWRGGGRGRKACVISLEVKQSSKVMMSRPSRSRLHLARDEPCYSIALTVTHEPK